MSLLEQQPVHVYVPFLHKANDEHIRPELFLTKLYYSRLTAFFSRTTWVS